jgi:hypothetical protein
VYPWLCDALPALCVQADRLAMSPPRATQGRCARGVDNSAHLALRHCRPAAPPQLLQPPSRPHSRPLPAARRRGARRGTGDCWLQAGRHAGRQTGRLAGRQASRQADRQADRQAGALTCEPCGANARLASAASAGCNSGCVSTSEGGLPAPLHCQHSWASRRKAQAWASSSPRRSAAAWKAVRLKDCAPRAAGMV